MEISLVCQLPEIILAIFRGIFVFSAVFQNNDAFIPQFLEESVTIFCVTLGFRETILENTINW